MVPMIMDDFRVYRNRKGGNYGLAWPKLTRAGRIVYVRQLAMFRRHRDAILAGKEAARKLVRKAA